MSAIVVSPQVLMEDSSPTVSGRAGEIDGTLATLSAHVHGPTAEWQGRARARFSRRCHRLQTSARPLHQTLLGIR